MTWTVYMTKKAQKQLRKLPQLIRAFAELAVTNMEEQGVNPVEWDTLRTGKNEYRLRLNYRYRMRYRVRPEYSLRIEVFYIGHRRDAYR